MEHFAALQNAASPFGIELKLGDGFAAAELDYADPADDPRSVELNGTYAIEAALVGRLLSSRPVVVTVTDADYATGVEKLRACVNSTAYPPCNAGLASAIGDAIPLHGDIVKVSMPPPGSDERFELTLAALARPAIAAAAADRVARWYAGASYGRYRELRDDGGVAVQGMLWLLRARILTDGTGSGDAVAAALDRYASALSDLRSTWRG